MHVKANLRSFVTALVFTHLIALPLSAQQGNGLRDISNVQVNTRQLEEAVASRTLTWLTGSSSNNDYISVGRAANFFGFVALRVSSNHSLTRAKVANHTLSVLSEAQRAVLVDLVSEQRPALAATQAARFEMNRALEGLLVSEPLSEEAFLELGRRYGAAEAEVGRVIGQALGDMAQTLSDAQLAQLTAIREAHVSGNGESIKSAKTRLKMPREDKQELVNLAARFLSWTTGNEAFNDFEVVGKPSQHFGFVSLRIDSNHGVRRGDVAKEVMGLLTPQQRGSITTSATENATLFTEFLSARAQLMRTLEGALAGTSIDPVQVKALGATIGEVEARMTWSQAKAMLDIRDTLSDDQSLQLLSMRAKYTGAQDTPAQDPVERGRQLFAQCTLCHVSDDQQASAPDILGIIDRAIADDAGFQDYSPALKAFAQAEGTWRKETLDRFLASPKSAVPGTIMGFDGLKEAADRAAVIAYLEARGN